MMGKTKRPDETSGLNMIFVGKRERAYSRP